MPGLLPALQGQRLLQDRIGDGFGEGRDDRAGTSLEIINVLPEGHLPEAVQCRLVQDRPGQRLWIIVEISSRKVRAKSISML